MKLKNESKVSYDEKSGSYVFDFDKRVKVGKVTSRMFPILLGKNKFQSIGWGILDRCKMVEKEEIDPYYMVRGAIGEIMVEKYIQKTYKEYGIKDIETKLFDVVSQGYDMFKRNDKFGGVVDIGISKPENARSVIEVKSKDTSKYDYYKKSIKTGGIDSLPEEEVYQGRQLAVLSKVDKLIMAYVFFKKKVENDIKDAMEKTSDPEEIIKELDLDYFNFDYLLVKENVDRDKVLHDMMKAHSKLQTISESGRIHKSMFLPEETTYLDSLCGRSGVTEDDLPF